VGIREAIRRKGERKEWRRPTRGRRMIRENQDRSWLDTRSEKTMNAKGMRVFDVDTAIGKKLRGLN
jgi:hypothetical protein